MSAYALSTTSLMQAPAFLVDQTGFPGVTPAKPVATSLRLVKAENCAANAWKSYIEEDPQGLLAALQRLVNSHALVRSALKGQSAAQGTSLLFSVQDITQDLYSVLLQKDRFRHYLQSGMSDAEIEREIYQVELTNYLVAALRRCRPENYRIVRRIGAILEQDSRFKVVQSSDHIARYRQSSESVFGLAVWSEDKLPADRQVAAARVAQIPMRKRDLRCVGCAGDTQVIISNQELTLLLEELLTALDEPVSLRVLRRLALSKLPVWDASLTPIETDADEERLGNGVHISSLLSEEATPEESVVQHENVTVAQKAAQALLARLHASTRENMERTERLWRVLWHCYFDPAEPSQLAIADLVKVSDSSIGDYRRKVEGEMRRLNLPFAEISHFADALRQELRLRLFHSNASSKIQTEKKPAELIGQTPKAKSPRLAASARRALWAQVG